MTTMRYRMYSRCSQVLHLNKIISHCDSAQITACQLCIWSGLSLKRLDFFVDTGKKTLHLNTSPQLCVNSHIALPAIASSQKQINDYPRRKPSEWSTNKRPVNQFQTSSWLEKVKFMESCFTVLEVSLTSQRMRSELCIGEMIKSNAWSSGIM